MNAIPSIAPEVYADRFRDRHDHATPAPADPRIPGRVEASDD